MHHACGWIKTVMTSVCSGKFSFTKKNKAKPKETKMNNDVCIISIKVKILSNRVSWKSKNIIKLAAERLFWPGFITYFIACEAWKTFKKVLFFLPHCAFIFRLTESDTDSGFFLFGKAAGEKLRDA